MGSGRRDTCRTRCRTRCHQSPASRAPAPRIDSQLLRLPQSFVLSTVAEKSSPEMPLRLLQPGEAQRRGEARNHLDKTTKGAAAAYAVQDRENRPPDEAEPRSRGASEPFPKPSEFTAWRRTGANTSVGGAPPRAEGGSVGMTCNPATPTTVQLAHSKEVAWLHFRKVPLGHTATLRMRVHNPQLTAQVRPAPST